MYLNQNKPLNLSKLWLFLGLGSVAVSGLYSIILICFRAPFLQKFFSGSDFFKTALIIHVDLSILVWFLSISCLFCAKIVKKQFQTYSKIAFYLSLVGTCLIPLSGFIPHVPLINNYIPVLLNLPFFIGISLFLCGVLIQSTVTLLSISKADFSFFQQSYYSIACLNIIAIAALGLSMQKYDLVHPISNAIDFYETIFWAPGHLLQFCYSQIAIVAWLKICTNHIHLERVNVKKFALGCIWLNVIISALGLIAFQRFSITSYDFKDFFTSHMIMFAGLIPSIFALFIIFTLIITKQVTKSPAINSLINSFILFFMGGIIGLIITGSDVTIPAHYHGSVVAVTLAVTGYIYILLPELGYNLALKKLSRIQPYIFGIGQIIHILALAYSGGHGVLRKDPSLITGKIKLVMGIMGLGGLMAIIGGLLFIIICFKTINQSTNKLID